MLFSNGEFYQGARQMSSLEIGFWKQQCSRMIPRRYGKPLPQEQHRQRFRDLAEWLGSIKKSKKNVEDRTNSNPRYCFIFAKITAKI